MSEPVSTFVIHVEVDTSETDPSTDVLFQRCVKMHVLPNPAIVAAFAAADVAQTGAYTWQCGVGAESSHAPFEILAEMVTPGVIAAGNAVKPTKDFYPFLRDSRAEDRIRRLSSSYAATPLRNTNFLRTHIGGHLPVPAWERTEENPSAYRRIPPPEYPEAGAESYAIVAVDPNRQGSAHIQFHTYFPPNDSAPSEVRSVLDIRGPGRSAKREAKLIRPDAASRVFDWASSKGFTFTGDTEALAALKARVETTVTVFPAPGRPAQAIASVGRDVDRKTRRKYAPDIGDVASAIVDLSNTDVASLRRVVPTAQLLIDPQVEDIVSLLNAEIFDDPSLRASQKAMVGLHLATNYGLVNALPTGEGKTICSAVAMRERARTIPNYRALVGLEAVVRKQWAGELNDWFPEAGVFMLETSKQAPELAKFLFEATGPVVVVSSYSLLGACAGSNDTDADASTDKVLAAVPQLVEFLPVKTDSAGQGLLFDFEFTLNDSPVVETETVVENQPFLYTEGADVDLGELLLAFNWNDLVADEATILSSNTSKASRGMWNLRAVSDVATALSATPADKDMDGFGRIIAWCRGRRDLFAGHRLEKLFDTHEPEEAARLFRDAIGPLYYRVDKGADPENGTPEVSASVVELQPSTGEYALARAARDELKKVYEELVHCVEVNEQADPDNPAFDAIREDLAAARGAWLGGTTLALMACADPQTVADSDSAGALLLASQGLIEAAVNDGGTKRKWLRDELLARCERGDKVLVFTQFARVARNLLDDLAEAGLAVGGILGGGGKRRDKVVEDFQAGDLDVIVSTKAGEKGLNLQRANVLVHYDLPWKPSDFQQRNGRFDRIGSEHTEVEVLIPLMMGTLEVRVVNIMASRAVKSMLALDTYDGQSHAESSVGKTFASLVDVNVDESLASGQSVMLAVGAALLGSDD